jgi:hypothetical protein
MKNTKKYDKNEEIENIILLLKKEILKLKTSQRR